MPIIPLSVESLMYFEFSPPISKMFSASAWSVPTPTAVVLNSFSNGNPRLDPMSLPADPVAMIASTSPGSTRAKSSARSAEAASSGLP
jgi:hypothetical protein